MGLTVASVLKDFAVDAEKAAGAQPSPVATAVFLGSAAVLRVVAGIIAGKTETEALAHLEHIRDHGTTPISAADKDPQIGVAVDHAMGR